MKPAALTDRSMWAAAVAAALTLCILGAGNLEAQNPGPPLIGAIEVAGNSRIPESSIIGVLTFRVGDRVTQVDLQRAIGRLWATGQFDDLTVYVVADSAQLTDPNAALTLRLEVVERPLLSSVEFRGLENVSGTTVRDTAGLRLGRPLNPASVTEAEAMIRSLLADKGFFARSIEHEILDVPDQPDAKRVVFDVEEGLRVAIADVEFEGNEAFTDEQLAGALSTKAEGFWWFRSGTFDEEKFRSDLREQLPAYYFSDGYLDFAVSGDTLIVDPLSGKARLIIRLDEGPQYRLASFDIIGNRHFSTDVLRRYFEEGRGGLLRNFGLGGGERQVEGQSIFDAVAFEAATDEVRQLYQNDGYLYSQVTPNLERIPGDSIGPLVRVAWQIIENNPAFIDEVNIVGNTFTHENVIRGQLIVLPGDLYSQERIIQSYQRISALGFFETPLPTPQIVPDPETGDVDITFVVKEQQTGSVNFGTSLGGYSGVAGFLGYDQPNLFGQAKSGHLRWEYGRFSNNFEASYTDPAIRGSFYSGSFSLFSSSDRFFTFSEGRRRRTGTGVQVGFPLWSDIRTRLSVGYSISRTTYEEFDNESTSTLFSLPPGVQSTMSLGIQRSTTDHPLFPTVGTNSQVQAELSGGLLGGDGDFQKYTISGEWYVPVGQFGGTAPGTRPIRFTLGLTAEAGAIFGDASRFPFDRFWMGGVQFGTSLRGYDETTITPLGYSDRNSGLPLTERFGDAYMRLSAMYAIRFNDNISLGLFYDAGNVWLRPSEINPTKLARGAGIGLTLVTPFGPLGLDYAYGFDKRPPGWQLHFKFGQGF